MIKAYILGTVTGQKNLEVLRNVKSIKGVKNVEFVYGKYDFIAEIDAENETKLSTVILEKLRKIPDLQSTRTLIAHKII